MSINHSRSKIIHIDMDYFYAQVEMLEDPNLHNKPVIISGPPDSRSVVCTASYKAREFGVHAGMSAYVAAKKCPQAIFIAPHFEKYQHYSKEMHKIFRKYTDIIEPLSLDEAYLDVTVNKKGITSATVVAQNIQMEIYQTLKLTCSAGVSYNKFIAKIASDYQKPSGITVIPPDHAIAFLETLEIKKFPGVGKKGVKKFYDYGIYTGGDFKKLSLEKAQKYFSKLGTTLYYRVRGIDDRHIIVNREVKSIGFERTLKTNVSKKSEIIEIFKKIVRHNEDRLRNKKKWAKTITIKVKFDDFSQITRSKTNDYPIREYSDIMPIVLELLETVELKDKKIRLLGTSGSALFDKPRVRNNFEKKIYIQILLDLKFR